MNKLFKRLRFLRELKQLARENLSQGKPLSILDDTVFKAMLGSNSEDSNEALRSLLSACIRREVREVQILNNDLVPAYLGAKTGRLDVHVTFNDGETADLEMQTDKYGDDLKKRAEFYASALLVGQHKRGKLYGSAKRVYQIFFLNCVLFPQSDKFFRRYFFQEEEEHDRLSDGVEIIFYELPKLETRFKDCLTGGGAEIENLRKDEKWCIYMGYRHEEGAEKLIEELCQKEAGIMRAENVVRKISREYKQYARNVAEMKNSYDLQLAEERGLKEGRQEGIAEKALEIARKMKNAGRPLSEIAEFTGLSTETIEQM